MTARALVSGALHRVTRKTSGNGNPYLMVTIREGTGDAVRWWTVFAFRDSVIEEIERLSAGDALAVSGPIEAKIYAPAGAEPKVSLSLTADALISTRAPKRERKDKSEGAASPSEAKPRGHARASNMAPAGEFADEIPF